MPTFTIRSLSDHCDKLCSDITLASATNPEAEPAKARLRNLKAMLMDPTLDDVDVITWAPELLERLSRVDPTTTAGQSTILAAVPINPPGMDNTFRGQASGDMTFP